MSINFPEMAGIIPALSGLNLELPPGLVLSPTPPIPVGLANPTIVPYQSAATHKETTNSKSSQQIACWNEWAPHFKIYEITRSCGPRNSVDEKLQTTGSKFTNTHQWFIFRLTNFASAAAYDGVVSHFKNVVTIHQPPVYDQKLDKIDPKYRIQMINYKYAVKECLISGAIMSNALEYSFDITRGLPDPPPHWFQKKTVTDYLKAKIDILFGTDDSQLMDAAIEAGIIDPTLIYHPLSLSRK
jgi:hypothetical protein